MDLTRLNELMGALCDDCRIMLTKPKFIVSPKRIVKNLCEECKYNLEKIAKIDLENEKLKEKNDD